MSFTMDGVNSQDPSDNLQILHVEKDVMDAKNDGNQQELPPPSLVVDSFPTNAVDTELSGASNENLTGIEVEDGKRCISNLNQDFVESTERNEINGNWNINSMSMNKSTSPTYDEPHDINEDINEVQAKHNPMNNLHEATTPLELETRNSLLYEKKETTTTEHNTMSTLNDTTTTTTEHNTNSTLLNEPSDDDVHVEKEEVNNINEPAELKVENVKTSLGNENLSMDEGMHNMNASESESNSLRLLEMELKKRHPDAYTIQQLWKELRYITADLRYWVWQTLLGVDNLCSNTPNQSIPKVQGDLENQRVIQVDAERTRGKMPYFKKTETINMVSNLLTYYCKCRTIRYKQGMNEVLAPFIMLLDPPLPDGVIFNLFYALVAKFLPNIYSDNEFRSLQCSFRLFRLLLLYHDPQLCHALDQNDMSPELYATPWFMTLFARNLEPELLFYLWDFFIINNDPFLLHFVSYSLLTSRREILLKVDAATLPETLTSISFQSIQDIQDICQNAFLVQSHTPKTFLRDLYTACYAPVTDATIPILHHLETSSCLSVSTQELVAQLSRNQEMNSNSTKDCGNLIKFFILDCRTKREFNRCHLSLSYHMDPDLLTAPETLKNVVEGFGKMKGCHFCLVGSGIDHSSTSQKKSVDSSREDSQIGKQENLCVTRFVLLLLQKGFQFVSKAEDGFATVLQGIELLDASIQDQILVKEVVNIEESGFKSRAKRAANGIMERIRASNMDSTTETESNSTNTPPPTTTTKSGIISSRVNQTLYTIKLAAKEAVTVVRRANSSNSSDLEKMTKEEAFAFSYSDQTIEGNEWIGISEPTKSQSHHAREHREVILGEGHLGILFKGIKGGTKGEEELQTIVDSVIPGSAAALSGSISRGDILQAVNGRDIIGVPFKESMAILKSSPRPLVLRFQLPQPKMICDIDAICSPLNPPILVASTANSICISWDQRAGGTRYQLQYAKRSDYYFNPWQSIGIIESKSDDNKPVVTSGTVVGLECDSAYVFRVRCGTLESWGSYSLSSAPMLTFNENGENPKIPLSPKDPISVMRKESVLSHKVDFLPGICPEIRVEGTFYYRVLIACAARATPDFNGRKLEKSLNAGNIIQCCERLSKPGSSQIYVKLCDKEEAWAFESTPDGAVVLQHLPEYKEANPYAKAKSTTLESNSSSGVKSTTLENSSSCSSSCSSSVIKSTLESSSCSSPSSPSSSSMATRTTATPSSMIEALEAPTILPCSSTSLLISWVLPDSTVEKKSVISRYQVMFSRYTSVFHWKTIEEEFDAKTHCCTIEGLEPNTLYVAKVRAGSKVDWGPYSSISSHVSTLSESRIGDKKNLGIHKNPTVESLQQRYSAAATSLFGKAVAAASKASKPKTPSLSSKEDHAMIDEEMINLEEWKRDRKDGGNEIHFFTGEKVNEKGVLCPCHIIITSGYFISAQDTTKPGMATIQVKEHLRLLSKITSRKAMKDFVVFHFKEGDTTGIHQIEYKIDEMKQCIQVIKENYKQIVASKSQ